MAGKVVDVRGLSCPQPAVIAQQALAAVGEGTVQVLVDSATARDNVTRLAGLAGWQVTVEELANGDFRVVIAR